MNRGGGNRLIWTLFALLLIVLAFYFGFRSGAESSPVPGSAATTTASSAESGGYYENPSQWQTYRDDSAGYSIAYPIDFSTDEPSSPSPSTDWRINNADQTPGEKRFTLTIPAAFEPQTNFAEATLTVGYSQTPKAIADCLVAGQGEATSSAQAVNNADFSVFTSKGVGAGQIYDTTSYRATHAGACYAVEYTIHSSQLGNYPASYGLQQYDQAKLDDVLNRIAGTFTFL